MVLFSATSPTRPVLLQANNFTPRERTPWGGFRLTRDLKDGVPLQQVGESWELSVEPDFPSRVVLPEERLGPHLGRVISDAPEAWLGQEWIDGRASTALLVKLLDAAEPLSVQIHPSDDAPWLDAEESGKPEAWYIVHAEPNAGLYIGLRDGTTKEHFATALDSESGTVDQLMNFVRVRPGDFFLIEAGTPHAIGAGVTLVEPQRVLPGKRGLTYRYWDWNRRYDKTGSPSPTGIPRPLHREAALRCTNWDAPRGERFIDRVRVQTPVSSGQLKANPRQTKLCGQALDDSPSHSLSSPSLEVSRLTGTGPFSYPMQNRLVALTVLSGSVTIPTHTDVPMVVSHGRTAALPACFEETLHLENTLAILSAAQ